MVDTGTRTEFCNITWRTSRNISRHFSLNLKPKLRAWFWPWFENDRFYLFLLLDMLSAKINAPLILKADFHQQ